MQVIKPKIRESILASAEKEFSEKGFSAASVRSIACNAGTSAGNLYKYYKNKEALFLAVVLPVVDECIGMVDRAFDFSEAGLVHSVALMADYVSAHERVFKALTSGPTGHYSAFLLRFTSCISRKLREYALSAVPDAVSRISNPAFFDVVASCYVGGLRRIMEQFSDRNAAEAYLCELTEFLFRGFLGRLEDISNANNQEI
ncbi:MAG: TetR/AcrR family transcriptional regulator [Acetivibrionales bacterium]